MKESPRFVPTDTSESTVALRDDKIRPTPQSLSETTRYITRQRVPLKHSNHSSTLEQIYHQQSQQMCCGRDISRDDVCRRRCAASVPIPLVFCRF
ncbi:hypothetical protein J6590_013851 [Homalodisca vitripennis]|nr:hypothetical protein J6590_013851 [Homalodisca vitripennis]